MSSNRALLELKLGLLRPHTTSEEFLRHSSRRPLAGAIICLTAVPGLLRVNGLPPSFRVFAEPGRRRVGAPRKTVGFAICPLRGAETPMRGPVARGAVSPFRH